MASNHQNFDLPTANFAIAPVGQAHQSADHQPTRKSYFRPDEAGPQRNMMNNSNDPTCVLSTSIDSQRAFPLINQIIPFEACLYHQILPLYIEDNELYLGMVDLTDTDAITYARRMVGYLKYQLIPQTITSETHHQVLSTYLNHQSQVDDRLVIAKPVAASLRVDAEAVRETFHQNGITDETFHQNGITTETFHQNGITDETFHQNDITTETFHQNGITDETFHQNDITVTHTTGDAHHGDTADRSDETETAPPSPNPAKLQEALRDTLTHFNVTQPCTQRDQSRSIAAESGPKESTQDLGIASARPEPVFDLPGSALPELKLKPAQIGPNWQSLSGAEFIHGLLIRMMSGGVGRLLLANKTDFGQVIWAENGVAKMVLEPVPLVQFQDAINELKQLTHLPPAPIEKPTEVEIERFYEQQRILLRLRIAPKGVGEAATVQVLRGAARKFYQKQQVQGLQRDTKVIAEKIRQKILARDKRSAEFGEFPVDCISSPQINQIDQTITSLEATLTQLKQLRQSLLGNIDE